MVDALHKKLPRPLGVGHGLLLKLLRRYFRAEEQYLGCARLQVAIQAGPAA